MNDLPKVSVIVPIYNVERYLYRCIESIINQTLKDIEIILVDDGSTDGSSKIIDEFSFKDSRIKVIHKKNEGQGAARNDGIKVAKGEYIGFVDGDDYIDLEMYEKLYVETSNNDFDIGVSSRCIVNELGEVIYELKIDNEEIFIRDTSEYIVSKLLYKHTVSVCNKIYRLNLIKKISANFLSVNEVGSEDTLFNYRCLLNAKKIKEVGEAFYFGVYRENSTTRVFKSKAMIRSSNLLNKIYEYSNEFNMEHEGKINAIVLNLFFQQYNYDNIKKFIEEDSRMEILKDEIKLGYKKSGLRIASKEFLLSAKADGYLKKLGYRKKGLIFARLYNLFCLIGLNGIAAKFRLVGSNCGG